MKPVKVGVLALQGAFAKHIEMLNSLGAQTKEVRKPEDLNDCDALIIPGGESTSMMRQIKFIGLIESLNQFAQRKPIFGTCAGLILMSQEIIADKMQPFHWLDIVVERNAFGRQAESFTTEIDVNLQSGHPQHLAAIFIRAPRIRKCGSEVKVLATYEGEPVLVRQGWNLGATFHPELTYDSSIHAYFIKMIRNA